MSTPGHVFEPTVPLPTSIFATQDGSSLHLAPPPHHRLCPFFSLSLSSFFLSFVFFSDFLNDYKKNRAFLRSGQLSSACFSLLLASLAAVLPSPPPPTSLSDPNHSPIHYHPSLRTRYFSSSLTRQIYKDTQIGPGLDSTGTVVRIIAVEFFFGRVRSIPPGARDIGLFWARLGISQCHCRSLGSLSFELAPTVCTPIEGVKSDLVMKSVEK